MRQVYTRHANPSNEENCPVRSPHRAAQGQDGNSNQDDQEYDLDGPSRPVEPLGGRGIAPIKGVRQAA
jgi:hypothetical protein